MHDFSNLKMGEKKENTLLKNLTHFSTGTIEFPELYEDRESVPGISQISHLTFYDAILLKGSKASLFE